MSCYIHVVLFSCIKVNNYEWTDNLIIKVDLYEVEKFDDGNRSLHNLSGQELRAMDEIIVNVSTATICVLLEEMKPLLMQVITG